MNTKPRNPDTGRTANRKRGTARDGGMSASGSVADPAAEESAAGRSWAVGWEQREWEQTGVSMMSRRVRLVSRGPYRAAVPARIAGLRLDIDPNVAAEAEAALVEIARFDSELATLLPEAEGREFAPLAAVLLRTESASSSQIENITAGARSLALAVLNEKTGPNARMVARNVAAMEKAIEMSDDLRLDAILAAHAALMEGQAHVLPGRLRDVQVWIGGSSLSPHLAVFVPPHHDRVAAAMDDLEEFLRRADLPLLAQAAVAHAQFETIHPFADGNGRTGRALVHAILRHGGATARLTVPVSAGLMADTVGYFDALTAYRNGDSNPIVRRFAEASLRAVWNGRKLADDLRSICDTWASSLRARSDAVVWRILPSLLSQPAVTVASVQRATGVSQPAAWNAIGQLVRADILTPVSANRRNRAWVAEHVTTALDEFAARAGRRTWNAS